MTSVFNITPATSEERDWAARLLSTSEPWLTLGTTLQQCKKVCYDRQYHIFVAHLNHEPCGVIILHPTGFASSPYIKSIAVAELFRNQKVGSRLVGFAENHFHMESKHLFLCVSSFNVKARQFYERMGYRTVGELKDYVIEGESEILLGKRLQ